MEEERKIEKLLRAYAKKRRADAGDPLKLHPAARRLLQAEVARRRARPEEGDSLSLWALFRQQWAFLMGFALIIFVAATMLLPALSSSKKKAQSLSAMNNLKRIGFAAQTAASDANGTLPSSLDELTNQQVPPAVLIDPQSGKPFVYAVGGRNLDMLQSNTVLAYSPEDKNGRVVLLADGTVEHADRERFAKLTNQMVLALAKDNESSAAQFEGATYASAPVAAPPAAAPLLRPPSNINGFETSNGEVSDQLQQVVRTVNAVNTETIQFGARAVQQLAQKQIGALQNSFRNNVVADKSAAVLANFLVQQTGNAIRILDADGSVYDGSVLDNYANAPVSTGLPGLPREEFKAVDQNAGSIGGGQSAAQNYFFRVAGTNLTLKKNVVFTGNLMVSNNVALSGMSGSNSVIQGRDLSGQQSTRNRPQSAVWSNARIAGTAVVSDTNLIQIDATSP
jgi:type II secretory pathway pseudopilin PulG